MSHSKDIQYIDTPAALETLCRQLADSTWIALDTEFLREKTYYPKFCLLQVATRECVACIDPLVLEDMGLLMDVIFNKEITKVMHAARQDMEIFYHLRGEVPAPVFDTQIASLLLGFPDQVGYAALVEDSLGVKLEKLHSRTDWTHRPLDQAQIDYAADDVIYLGQLYLQMKNKLEELGRLEWLTEDFGRLSDPALYQKAPGDVWKKVRGHDRLRGPALSVLQSLAAWREETARQEDRPRNWLLRDEAMIDLSRHIPKTTTELGRVRGLHERVLKKHGQGLLEIIGGAIERPPQPLPASEKRNRPLPAQEALVDAMMAVTRLSAIENSLNPAVLATRKELERLATGSEDTDVMRGWRKGMLGERLRALLNGELSLHVADGVLELEK